MLEKLSIGIDIVDVNDFRKIPFSKRPEFYKKLFNISEINYCLKYKNPYEHFAGKFAVKEAVKKAIPEKLSPLEILTYHNNCKPMVRLKKFNKKYLILTSLSHEKKF